MASYDTIFETVVGSILGTRTGYPHLIVGPHALWACATYRKELQSRGTPVHWIASIIGSFFLYGWGGTLISDLMMGTGYTSISHPRIVPCFLAAWLLVWFSPGDVVYRLAQRAGPVRYVLAIGEAWDAAMTPIGRAARAAKNFPASTVAPLIGGLLAGTGGAALRYAEKRLFAPTVARSFDELEAAIWRTCGYLVIFWVMAILPCHLSPDDGEILDSKRRAELNCADFGGPDHVRICLLLFHAGWTELSELGLPKKLFGTVKHPFVLLAHTVLGVLQPFGGLFGPAEWPAGWTGPATESKAKKRDDKEAEADSSATVSKRRKIE